ncbi:MAG: glutathione S-transferase family protein [Deltaproteobacteria bacterium]|nr:glutathione S-transferase family protein [Deltaproteobacteria bacterium]
MMRLHRYRLHGRRTSHFTRVVLIVAHELDVSIDLVHVDDLFSLDPDHYGGHPALKVPCLHVGETMHVGAQNIARVLRRSSAHGSRVLFAEAIDDDLVRNAEELVWTAMGLEVHVVLGRMASRAEDDPLLRKSRVALTNVLAWLEPRLASILERLPPRHTSLLEIALFCLIEHVSLRATVSIEDRPRLRAFATTFGERASARATDPR